MAMAEEVDTRSRLLDAVINMIETSGEASVRLQLVADVVGISEPSIYGHFKNRSELITAAYLSWYERSLLTAVSPESMMEMVHSSDDFFRVFRESLEWSYVPKRAKDRSIRMSVAGAAQTNPDLKNAINELHRSFLGAAANNIRIAQDKGWVRADIDPVAFVYWLNGQITGRLLAEMAMGEVDLDAWNEVSFDAVFRMLQPENS